MSTIEENVAFVRSLSDDPAVANLLDLSILRVLLKPGSDVLLDLPDYEQARHVADWLRAAVSRNESWISNVDDLGRPKKLMKFSKFEDIVKEADKAMRKAISKDGVKNLPSNQSVFLELEDGFRLVELLDKGALQKESSAMQHCVGNGGYDYVLEKEHQMILSLRDRHDKSHATLHVDVEHKALLQMRGKQNKPPHAKYMRVLFPYVSGFDARGIVFGPAGFVVDTEGRRHELHSMPADIVIDGHLDLSNTKLRRLPDGLTIKGGLELSGSKLRELPERLKVHGGLNIGTKRSKIRSLPSDLDVGDFINLSFSRITALPSGIKARAIVANYSKIREIGEGLRLEGNLELRQCPVTSLPDDLDVGGELNLSCTRITALPSTIRCGGLDISSTRVSHLPDGLVRGGNVNCDFTRIAELPKSLRVVGTLSIMATDISELPADLSGVTYLQAARSKLTSIPERLFPLEMLAIDGTAIRQLPSCCTGLSVLSADETDLENLPDNMEVGSLCLGKSGITRLPENLKVNENLSIEGSAIEHLPDNLKIGGYLNATGSALKTIGRGVEVGGHFKVSKTQLREIPDDFRMPQSRPHWRAFEVASTEVAKLPDMDVDFYEVDISGSKVECFPSKWKTSRLMANNSALSTVEGRVKFIFHKTPNFVDTGTRRVKFYYYDETFLGLFKEGIREIAQQMAQYVMNMPKAAVRALRLGFHVNGQR